MPSDDQDLYDLVDEPAPPRPALRPLAAQAGAGAVLSAIPASAQETAPGAAGTPPTLAYARPGTLNTPSAIADARARGGAADPLLLAHDRRHTFTVPVILILTCSAVVFACGWGISGSLIDGARWAALSVLWDVVIIFAGIFVGSRLVDIEAESIATLALQVTAIVLADAAVFWPILWLDRGAFCGALTAWILSTIAFCWLLSYLFDLEMSEVIVLAVVILVVRMIANLGWLSIFGSFGYLPY